MRFSIFFVFLASFASNIFCQELDLNQLSTDDFLSVRYIDDDKDRFFGYVVLFKGEKSAIMQADYEVFILDPDYNVMTQGSFVGSRAINGMNAYFNRDNRLILVPKVQKSGWNKKERQAYFYPMSRVIDLSSGDVSLYERSCMTDTRLTNCAQYVLRDSTKKAIRQQLKSSGILDRSAVHRMAHEEHLAFAWKGHYDELGQNQEKIDQLTMSMYDSKDQMVWKKDLYPQATSDRYAWYDVIYTNDNFVCIYLHEGTFAKPQKATMILYETKTGRELNSLFVWDNRDSKETRAPITIHDNEDDIIIYGYHLASVQPAEKPYGFYRVTISKTSHDMSIDSFKMSQLSPFVKDITYKGEIPGGFVLSPRKIFHRADGSSVIVTELVRLFKIQFGGKRFDSKDFILFETDKDFKVVSHIVIDKQKQLANMTDLEFTQKFESDTNHAFYYIKEKSDRYGEDVHSVLGTVRLWGGELKVEEKRLDKTRLSRKLLKGKIGRVVFHQHDKNYKVNKLSTYKIGLLAQFDLVQN